MKLLNELPPAAHKGELVCFDVETFGQPDGKIHRPTGTFACLSINLERDPDTVYQIYDSHDVKKVLLTAKTGTWVFHNALYDLRQMMRYTEIQHRFIWDIMLVEQSLYGGYYTYFNLKDMSRRWLDEIVDKETREHFSTATAMTPEMKKYAARDVVLTIRIAIKQRTEFEETNRLNTYHQIDEPMIWPILDMKGVRIDVGSWTKAVAEFDCEAKRLESELGFNVYSPLQVRKALAKAGLHLNSTGAEILAEFADRPIVEGILKARMYRKAVSTYGLSWLEENVEEDGCVYSSWHITGASMTGRMSSSDPNLQNIPARKMPIYRKFFIPDPKTVLTVEDVTQQEPCILGYESKDPALIEAIKSKEDLHQRIADAIHKDRKIGKAINLGISYGMTAPGLAARTGMKEEEAESIINQYFARFRGVFSWISERRNFAYQNGYVQTASGRRSHINPYDSQWQNNAINSPIQGGAADFTKVWVRGYWEECQHGLPYELRLIVHDEQVKNPHRSILVETNQASARGFEKAAETLFPGIPFRYDRKVGTSWAAKDDKEEALDEKALLLEDLGYEA